MPFVLQARRVDIDTGGSERVVLLRGHDAETFGINPGDRLQITIGKKNIFAVADVTHNSIEHGELGFFDDLWKQLKLKVPTPIIINVVSRPESVRAISKKLLGQPVTERDIRSIITDIVNHRLGSVETTYFVSSGYVKPYSDQEIVWMVRAMAETGDMFSWGKKVVVDKHSVGGLAGNRTTMVAIPIIAALGLCIPKTSSRAITSPAGTADTMEVLAPVIHDAPAVRRIVGQAGACLIWGGGLSIAPADDIIIRVSRPLSLEPYDKMIVSIMAKKVAMGVKVLIIDMPYGPGTKIPDRRTVQTLTERFTKVGKAFGMVVKVKADHAYQPVGSGIGPALEARDVLRVLQQTPNRPRDLERKAIGLAAELLELAKAARPGHGTVMATTALRSGAAWKKMQQIIKLQGGNPHVKPLDVVAGASRSIILAPRSGRITAIDNRGLDEIARALGAPDHKLAGVDLHRKLGQRVKIGEPWFSLMSYSPSRIAMAKTLLRRSPIMTIGH